MSYKVGLYSMFILFSIISYSNTFLAEALLCELPSITLFPTEGISTVTIEGTSFAPHSNITVSWCSFQVPTIPLHVLSNEEGNFSCIISVSNQTQGIYEITVEDSEGQVATAVFKVIDVTGKTGEQGPSGVSVEGIPPGFLAGWFFLASAIGGIIGVFLGRSLKNRN